MSAYSIFGKVIFFSYYNGFYLVSYLYKVWDLESFHTIEMTSNACLYFKVIVLARTIGPLILYRFLVMENVGGRSETIWKFPNFRITKFDPEFYVEVIVCVEKEGNYQIVSNLLFRCRSVCIAGNICLLRDNKPMDNHLCPQKNKWFLYCYKSWLLL